MFCENIILWRKVHKPQGKKSVDLYKANQPCKNHPDEEIAHYGFL